MQMNSPAITPQQQAAMEQVAVKLFLRLADEWALPEAEQLVLCGAASRTTLKRWRDKLDQGDPIKLNGDTLERLSVIAGIRKGVEVLYPKDQWNAFMRKPNEYLGGQSALERMLNGRIIDLYDVRRMLDGWRGASYA